MVLAGTFETVRKRTTRPPERSSQGQRGEISKARSAGKPKQWQ